MPEEKLTFWPSPFLFWLMVVVTIAALALLICLSVQWKVADERTNNWFDHMCAIHGGSYCQHELPPGNTTTPP
jgi:hypothetical protein